MEKEENQKNTNLDENKRPEEENGKSNENLQSENKQEINQKSEEEAKELTPEEKITELEDELRLIEEKDSELRTYATLAPLSDDVKAQGVGGSAEKDMLIDEVDDSAIMLLKDRVDSLAFAINIQKDSYNTIFNKIKSNEEELRIKERELKVKEEKNLFNILKEGFFNPSFFMCF